MIKSQEIIKIYCETPNFYTVGPKTTTSNRVTPIYPDMRRVMSYPKNLRATAKIIARFIKNRKIKYDFIVGGATAGIPLATALGLLLDKPFGYVRKEPKAGGMGLAVEGSYSPGMRAILVDDALAHGVAKRKFIRNIRTAGLKLEWVIVVISRTNRGRSGRETMSWSKKDRVKLQSFCDLYDLIDYSLKHKVITPEAWQLLKWYCDDAEGWNRDPKKWTYFKKYLRLPHPSKSGA